MSKYFTTRSERLLKEELDEGLIDPRDFIMRGLKELARFLFEGKESPKAYYFSPGENTFTKIEEYISLKFPSASGLVYESPCEYSADCEHADKCILREGYDSVMEFYEVDEGVLERMVKVRRTKILNNEPCWGRNDSVTTF
jgi:hypothetical protein